MSPHRSHILSPLNAKTGLPQKGVQAPPFKWIPEMHQAFEEMKALIAAEVLSAYPDHNKPFKIYTDASNYQLGAYIMHEDPLVAYYSRKLNCVQHDYATNEKRTSMCCCDIERIPINVTWCRLHIYTNHKNIPNVGNSSE
jgi:hypothetical protein